MALVRRIVFQILGVKGLKLNVHEHMHLYMWSTRLSKFTDRGSYSSSSFVEHKISDRMQQLYQLELLEFLFVSLGHEICNGKFCILLLTKYNSLVFSWEIPKIMLLWNLYNVCR